MDMIRRIRPIAVTTGTIVALTLSTAALASVDRAVKACKGAIEAEQGAEISTRLKKISSRGNSYEAWFNLSDGDTQMKAYCLSKRSDVEVITTEGSWKGRNPKRPS